MSARRSSMSRRRFLQRSGLAVAGATSLSAIAAACSDGSPTTAGSPTASPTASAGGSAAPTAGPDPVSYEVVLSWLPNTQWAGNWLALDRGYFDEQGVDLTHRPGGPNTPSAVELVAGGEVDFGIQSNMQGFMDAINAGNDFVAFGTQYQKNPAGLLSLADNPVRTPEDLVGKRVLGPNPVDARSIDAVLELAGLPVEYEFIPSGFSPEPLLAGQGDVMVVFVTNQPIALELQEGLEPDRDFFAVTYDDLGLPRYSTMYFGERRWVEENHDGLVRVMRAVLQGWADNEEDPEAGARLAVERYGVDLGLDLAAQVRQNELQIPLMHSDATEEHGLFWIDVEKLGGPMYEALRLTGLDQLPDPESVVDLSILEEARQ